MSEMLITEQELRDMLPEVDLGQYNTTTISGMIRQASDSIRNFCNVEGFLRANVTAEVGRIHTDPAGEVHFSVRRPKIRQGDLTSLVYKSIGQRQTMVLQQSGSDVYYVDASGYFVTYPNFYRVNFGIGLLSIPTYQMFYEINYVGGYADSVEELPYDLKEACILYMRDILGRRGNPAGVLSFRQGSYSETRGPSSGNTDNDTMYVAQANKLLIRGGYQRMVVG